MNPVSSNQKFKKILFWFTAIFLAAHILMASLIISLAADFPTGKLSSFYNRLLLLGPYFSDSRLMTSPHLYVSHSASGSWTPFEDVALKNLISFQQHPWQYDKLKWSEYERYAARNAYTEIKALKQIDGSEGSASLELTRYANLHYQFDSIRLLNVWNTWRPENQSIKTDTAFFVVFKPKNVGLSR